jgi:hypothetical protein
VERAAFCIILILIAHLTAGVTLGVNLSGRPAGRIGFGNGSVSLGIVFQTLRGRPLWHLVELRSGESVLGRCQEWERLEPEGPNSPQEFPYHLFLSVKCHN